MDYKRINDYEVLYMIKENDDEAEGLMYRKYLPIIKGIASRYLKSVSNRGADFDDLVQEGYIGLSNAICSYRDDKNTIFYSYACLCIERQIGIYCRNLSSKKNEILNTCLFNDDLVHNKINDDIVSEPENFSLQNLAYQKFLDYKNYFDIENSCIFELRYNGFTYREISKLLDISVSTIDGRLSKIRKTLQKLEKNFV